MVSQILGAARLATRDTMARFLDRSLLRRRTVGGRWITRPMSIREIHRRTGMPRSTIQDFMLDPLKSLPRTVQRMTSLLDDPRLRLAQPGERVMFIDAPRFTAESLRDLSVPEDSQAVRFISETLASPGREYGSTDWLFIDGDIDELAGFVPGGPEAITRVLFDTSA